MRRAIFILFVAFGAGLGLIASLDDALGLKVVMMCIGALAGTAIGGAISMHGRTPGGRSSIDDDSTGLGTLEADRMSNHWLDRGRPTASPGLPHADDTDPFSPER